MTQLPDGFWMAIIALISSVAAWVKANAAQRQGNRNASEIDVIGESMAVKDSGTPAIREARQAALQAVEEAMNQNNREMAAAVEAAYRRGRQEAADEIQRGERGLSTGPPRPAPTL